MRMPFLRFTKLGFLIGTLAVVGGTRPLASQSPSTALPGADTSPPRPQRSGYTGLEFTVRITMTPDQKYHAGYSQISGIHPGSPGERAGFKIGDVILAVNGVDARTPKALFFAPQQRYVVRIRRGTEEREQILIPAVPAT